MNKIPNTQLTEESIPSQDANWNKVLPFALTFNGYDYWGSFKKCREIAEQGVKLYRGKQELTQSLTDLRTCLFFEARRWRHYEKTPTQKAMGYIHALIAAIRIRVISKAIG